MSDGYMNEERRMMQQAAREFTQAEVLPVAFQPSFWSREGRVVVGRRFGAPWGRPNRGGVG